MPSTRLAGLLGKLVTGIDGACKIAHAGAN
jgi:hypothetical protein